MQDLRDEKKISKEEGKPISTKETDKWTVINNVCLKVYNRGLFIVKSYKYVWIGIIAILIALFPIEIGEFLGNWIYFFYINFTKNFK